MPIVRTLGTQDRQYRVYLHADHTAELCDQQGRMILGRVDLHQITQRLAEFGYRGDELELDE